MMPESLNQAAEAPAAPSRLRGRLLVGAVAALATLAILRAGGWWLVLPVAMLAALGTLEAYRIGRLAVGVAGMPRHAGAIAAGLLPMAALVSDGLREFASVGFAVVAALAVLAVVRAVFGGGPKAPGLAGASLTLFGTVWVGVPLALAISLHGFPAEAGWTALPVEGTNGAALGSEPAEVNRELRESGTADWLAALAGPPGAWSGLLVVMFPLAVTWTNDSLAFLGGRRWGRRRMAPELSPAKTWEGAVLGMAGAVGAATAWALLAAPLLPLARLNPWLVIVSGAVIGVAGQVGDLAASLFKREAGVKDTGSFFGSHGGVLDRIDSLLLAIPVGYASLVLLHWLS